MTTSLKVLKSGLKLSLNQVFIQGCSFVRNVIIARLISPADFGIAALLAMTFSSLEMSSNLAQEKLLIQAEDGDRPSFQNTVHLLQAGRGFMNALLIFLLAGPVAGLFELPQTTWAFRCLALVPLIRGLVHTDLFRVQRDLRFEPSIIVDVVSSIVLVLVALPLALWHRDYTVMLWVLVAQSLCAAIGSHLVAERRYGWAWNRSYLKKIFSFGWPLLINGLLMYLIFDGDRLMIGAARRLFHVNSYNLTDLGIYSVAFAITMGPTMLVANVSTSLFLPILSHAHTREHFERRYLGCAQMVCLIAAIIAVPFIIAGGWVTILLYGKKYVAASGFIGWLAAMWAFRMARQGPTLAAMALGDTKNAMISNIVRASAFLALLLVAATGRSLVWIAACGFFGELLALAACVWRLERVRGVPAALFTRPFAVSAAGMTAAALTVVLGASRHGWPMALAISAVLVAVLSVAMFSFFPGLRQDVRALLFQLNPSSGSHSKRLESGLAAPTLSS